jgi:hypothetical protein
MAGLSISRRRKAFRAGVLAGALGRGKCRLKLEKLKAIYHRGVEYAKLNPRSPLVRAVVDEKRRRMQVQGKRRRRTYVEREGRR